MILNTYFHLAIFLGTYAAFFWIFDITPTTVGMFGGVIALVIAGIIQELWDRRKK